jgi:hypothetical protein
LGNLWFFRKQLWEFRSWDYSFNLQLLSRSLEKTANTLKFHGNEVDVTRLKKVQKINRVIEIIGNIRENNYLSKAELELGEIILRNNWMFTDEDENPEIIAHNKKIYDRADVLEELEWNELFDILKGQNFDEYKTLMDKKSPEEKNKMNVWNDWYDGSGIRNWWD